MMTENETLREGILTGAKQICVAARTAPKSCGRDSIVTAILSGDEIGTLTDAMRAIEAERDAPKKIFERDAALVESCAAVVLIGCTREPRRLYPCSLCGYRSCTSALDGGGHCVFDDIDLGIALGSATAMAADLRIDNRLLYTAGMAALRLKLLGEDVKAVVALPLCADARNRFFMP